jgi:hypothetical protein
LKENISTLIIFYLYKICFKLPLPSLASARPDYLEAEGLFLKTNKNQPLPGFRQASGGKGFEACLIKKE